MAAGCLVRLSSWLSPLPDLHAVTPLHTNKDKTITMETITQKPSPWLFFILFLRAAEAAAWKVEFCDDRCEFPFEAQKTPLLKLKVSLLGLCEDFLLWSQRRHQPSHIMTCVMLSVFVQSSLDVRPAYTWMRGQEWGVAFLVPPGATVLPPALFPALW